MDILLARFVAWTMSFLVSTTSCSSCRIIVGRRYYDAGWQGGAGPFTNATTDATGPYLDMPIITDTQR